MYHLWVIEHAPNISKERLEKEFPAKRAGLNVLVVDDETPYHERKVTLLNGPHTVLAPVAYLSGINIVRDACNSTLLGRFVHKVQTEELLPTLDMPKEELEQFAKDVINRFKNPYIDHQLTSIMLNSFPKFKTRDLLDCANISIRQDSCRNVSCLVSLPSSPIIKEANALTGQR